MRKVVLFILVLCFLASGKLALANEPNDNKGTTYTYTGGEWTSKTSWQPNLQNDGGPGTDDNVYIPTEVEAVAPDTLDIATLTVEGKLTLGVDLRVNSLTVESGGVLIASPSIQCMGKLTNKGSISSQASLGIIAQNIDNIGSLTGYDKVNIVVIFNMKNTGILAAGKLLMLRCGDLVNEGKLSTTSIPGNIAVFSNKGFRNDGVVKACDGSAGSDGGNVWVAAQTFSGGGSVTPGNGSAGDPPGKAGKAEIGESFDEDSWSAGNPSSPVGNPPAELTDWNTQTTKIPVFDGRQLGTEFLTLSQPDGTKPMRGRTGWSYVCASGSTTITATLTWNGEGNVFARGTTTDGTLLNTYAFLRANAPKQIRIQVPPFDGDGLKVLNIKYTVNGTLYMATTKIYVYYAACPIIRGKVGETSCTIEDDKGQISDASLPTPPRIEHDRLVVPLRFMVESCGGSVSWNQTKREALITMPGRTVVFAPNSDSAEVNGFSETVYTTSQIEDGHMMVSARSLAEAIGAAVTWDDGEFEFRYPAE
ncbi:MAG TPA: copper amine oxidase N-terminal domain-containing protein [Caldisericia bacterium]|nr:copper amine oxidase N-terminal domain-containing protein [Caldisericia bacterium]HPF49758.1 copper amine oxidase N-terminal domain-containing protein [Caldisericia bacterium]HPI84319.1 copper amine oxidase N-terminal domain-containing protein [Caldisericia bacterium]HPQ93746.1 copper amine oxidase N-terminal domain-containing protein [Caldisericia bacterium]HRV74830.1 copper amine oxidase N-terminal domain-containing protein [Caldisericia bacterium]